MGSVSESAVCCACFSVLGKHVFYSDSELEQLRVADVSDTEVEHIKNLMLLPEQNLEDLFEQWLRDVRSRERRHETGMVFTPDATVLEMEASLEAHSFERVIDCGCGAGRFALHACDMLLQKSVGARVIAYDTDPLACLLTQTAACIMGLPVEVRREDFLFVRLPQAEGKTAFIGNPPYVKHHGMSARQKEQGLRLARELGLKGWSRLSGLHALFIAKCLSMSCPGDVLCFLTGAEWLDVNYGAPLRRAFASSVGGGQLLKLYSADVALFNNVQSTALISVWEPSCSKTSRVVYSYVDMESNAVTQSKTWDELLSVPKWSSRYVVGPCDDVPDEYIELGELFRVSRGVVTGNNGYFVMGKNECERSGLAPNCRPVVAKAADIPHDACTVGAANLKKVLLLAPDAIPDDDRALLEYIDAGEEQGVNKGHIASSRKTWWHITFRPAPILATYMGRGRPRFALNPERLPNLNTVHGLYPKIDMTREELYACVRYLNCGQLFGDAGRVYQGGLRKYEPREMERILIPPLKQIMEWSRNDEAEIVTAA